VILGGNQGPEEKEVKLRNQRTGCLHRRRNPSSPFRPRLAHMIGCRCHSCAQRRIWTVITATEIQHKHGYTPMTKTKRKEIRRGLIRLGFSTSRQKGRPIIGIDPWQRKRNTSTNVGMVKAAKPENCFPSSRPADGCFAAHTLFLPVTDATGIE